MMLKLLRKELLLAMHPFVPVTLLMSAMVFIPNYPYSVIFFYVSLAVFFTCLTGRENNDVVYSLSLPISKRDIVKARISFTVILQLLQLIVMIPLTLLSSMVNKAGNDAGMNANLALLGIAFIVYGVFNLVFFGGYYRNVKNVGKSFVISCVVIFFFVALEVTSTYAIPFVRDYLDTKDPFAYTEYKLAFCAVALLFYILTTFITYKRAVINFEKQDL